MSPQALQAIVMAAGKGTRLKSDTPKVLHPLLGQSLLARSLGCLRDLPPELVPDKAYLVIGHGREAVWEAAQALDLPFALRPVVQEPQLGTGHAVMQVQNALESPPPRDVLVTSGDVPLLRPASLARLVACHRDGGYRLTLLAAHLENPSGYGRVMLSEDAAGTRVTAIVEEKDATPAQRAVTLVNTGLYCLDWPAVSPLLARLSSDNAQGEFYLTDLIALAVAEGLSVGMAVLEDSNEMLGVNSRADLAACTAALNRRALERLMAEGVTVVDPARTLVAPEAEIGRDTVIYPGCVIEGPVTAGARCVIGPDTTLWGAVRLGDGAKVLHSHVVDSVIGSDTTVGPFAHLRDNAVLAEGVRIGNFVEVKNTRIAPNTNAAHLSYLGDADLGADVNIGAGTITANYDPVRKTKHRTVIGDGAKIGCNAVLVAPVTVGENACVAAGSVITRDVDPWDLAIARPKQSVIPQWVARILRPASR